MSQTVDAVADRETALAAFASAHRGLEAAFRAVLDEALTYCPEGDDYALGGLVLHVTEVLNHYRDVLDRIQTSEFGEVRVPADSEEVERDRAARLKAGLTAEERPAAFAALRSAHEELAAAVRAMPAGQHARKAPVYFGGTEEPFATGASDILGWMTDHYRDHAGQVADLLAAWRAETGRPNA